MIGIVYDDNGTKKIKPLAGASGSGLPLGAIIPLYTTKVPTGYLPCDGSTFDAAQYPALYGLLGTNVLPDKGYELDWDNAQSITLSTSDYVVQKDGWIVGTGINPSNSQMVKILINGVTVESSIGVSTYHSLPNIQVKVSKGDIVKLNIGSIESQDFHFVPYLHPMVIKAVSGITEADKDYVAAAVTETVEADLDASLKSYIRDQDILSDPEATTVSTSNRTAPYDGYVYTSTTCESQYYAYINDKPVVKFNGLTLNPFTFVLKKGDTYRQQGTQYSQAYARWYKCRDYTGR